MGGGGLQGYLPKWMYLFKLLWSLFTVFLSQSNNSVRSSRAKANSDSKYVRVNHSHLILGSTVFYSFFFHQDPENICRCYLKHPHHTAGTWRVEKHIMNTVRVLFPLPLWMVSALGGGGGSLPTHVPPASYWVWPIGSLSRSSGRGRRARQSFPGFLIV